MRNYGTLISACLVASAAGTAAKGVWATPHDSYSSSVGVLGCKINTNRVAYWPGSVDCDNICVKLTYESRSVHLLRIDQSGGAFDISYDAWVYLQTGKSATADPITGGTVAMEYEEVDASECADLIKTDGNKLPLSAANSMNFLTSCLDQPDSFVAKNHVLYNIQDAICSLGYDEECSLDLAVSNQPSCPHTLGLTTSLTSSPVYNIEYESGKTVDAATGDVATGVATGDSDDDSDGDDTSGSDSGSGSQAVTTSSASPSATPGVFFEVSTTQTSTSQSSAAPVSTEAPATQYSVVASSSSSSSASEQPTVVETSSSSTPVLTMTLAAPTTLVPSTTTSITQIVVNSTSTGAPTTFALVTASGRPSSTVSSSPSSSATVEVTNAGHANSAVSLLVLVASFVPFLVLGLF